MKKKKKTTIRMVLLVLMGLTLILGQASCTRLDGYRRTYSLSYVTKQGQPVGVGISLDPVTRSGK
jgi:hypothetical protein